MNVKCPFPKARGMCTFTWYIFQKSCNSLEFGFPSKCSDGNKMTLTKCIITKEHDKKIRMSINGQVGGDI